MSNRWIALMGALGLITATLAAAAPAPGMDVDIPFTRFTLKNGLTVVVHEDHKAPIVTVKVWYHVGSKDEPAGRTGFAHLYEHLMFTGTQHAPDGFNQLLARIGATDNNGTTNEDRTDYYENVPSNALDTALWMESERMGFFLPALDQKKLDTQRGVVQNEKRQDEDAPYGKVALHLADATYPAAHPYHHTVIGSMQDLDAASLADVQDWFKAWYGPNNAVLVIAGDVDTAAVRAKVEKYFGDIPPSPPVAHAKRWVAKMSGVQREILQDRVPAGRVMLVWNVPDGSDAAADYLSLVADVLAEGKASRLYERLVYDDQVAANVSAYVDTHEIGSQFVITATALKGKPLDKLEADIRDELARFLKSGPTLEELNRARNGEYAGFVRSVERITSVAEVLAEGQVYDGDPASYRVSLKRMQLATAADLKRAANDWLSDGVYILDVVPFGDYAPEGGGADHSQAPAPGEFPAFKFPARETATLSNGLKLVVVPRHGVPLVQFSLLLDAGYAADKGAAPGTAKLTLAALTAGTHHRDMLGISRELGDLGANLQAGSALDYSSVSLSTLKRNLDASLALYADVVLDPTFPDADVAKLRQQQIAAIQRERLSPVSMALRAFPRLLYGEGNAYSLPLTGSGYEGTVAKLTPADLRRFHDTWFKPNHATLIVVGDTTLAEIQPKLERRFGGWKPGAIPTKDLAQVQLPAQPAVYLVDRPGSEQSIIFAGNVAPGYGAPDNIAMQAMNTVLGGDFTSRINMNLREDKHWAYGAFSFVLSARGQRPFIAYAPVQADKTAESMAELQKELTGVVGDRPLTADELTRAKGLMTLTLPGDWETDSSVAGALATQSVYGLPPDYWDSYVQKVTSLSLADVNQAAKEVVHPGQLIWVVVGDLKQVEPAIRQLNLGAIHYVDADGNQVPAP